MNLRKTIVFIRFQLILLIFLLSGTSCLSQFFNKEIVADIKFEDKGEYLEFSATAENITPSDSNLRYDFMLYKTDENGNTSKSEQGNRFFLESYQKEILSTVTVNKSDDSKLIVVLLIYDQDDKPLGKDRLEFENNQQKVEEIKKEKAIAPSVSEDEAKPQDGFVINGLVIQNTITKVGRDFYKFFYSQFYNMEIETRHDIEIEEVPGRGRMTLITVKVADQPVLKFFGQPKKEYLKQMAKVAMQRSLAQLNKLEQQDTNFKHY